MALSRIKPEDNGLERLSAMETRMGGFESAMRDLAHEVHELGKAVARKHNFDPAAIISTIKDIAMLAVAVIGCIIWIVTSISDKPDAVFNMQIRQLERRIDFMQQQANWIQKRDAYVSEHEKGVR